MADSAISIQEKLRSEPVLKLMSRYSGPAIIECVAVSLYNIVDSVFIGHDVGAMALAALAIALPLMNLVIGFCTLITAGGSAIISIFIGRKDRDAALSTVNNVILMCIIHAVVFGGLMLLFLDPILKIFGATPATIGYAHRYMRIILLASPISYTFLGLNNLMRATGYPKKAMISALLSVAVNIAMCPIFINVLHWSIEGAALATVAGQFAAFIWCLIHFLSPKSLISIDTSYRWFTPKIVKQMYAIGMAPFLMNCCACIVVVFLNHSLLKEGGLMGNYDIGAYGILNRVTMVFIMIVQGVSMGMQPIIGFNFGAELWSRARKTLYYGIWVGAFITFIGWCLTELCPDVLSKIFTSNERLIIMARHGFRIYFICYPVVGAQIIIQNFFQYINHPKYSIALSMTRQMIFLLPLLIFLPKLLGVDGVWWSMAIADMLAFLLAIAVLMVAMRKFNRLYDAPQSATSATATVAATQPHQPGAPSSAPSGSPKP